MNGNKPKVKKDNTQAMKILCYFGIVFCTALIALPLVFRKVFPRPEESDEKKEQIATLSCNTEDNGETILVTYYGEEYLMGQIKYTVAANAESWVANDLYQDLSRNDTVVSRRTIEDRNSFDRVQFLLTPKDSNSNVLSQDELQVLSADNKKAPKSQKEYYEELGFTCTLKEENKTNS